MKRLGPVRADRSGDDAAGLVGVVGAGVGDDGVVDRLSYGQQDQGSRSRVRRPRSGRPGSGRGGPQVASTASHGAGDLARARASAGQRLEQRLLQVAEVVVGERRRSSGSLAARSAPGSCSSSLEAEPGAEHEAQVVEGAEPAQRLLLVELEASPCAGGQRVQRDGARVRAGRRAGRPRCSGGTRRRPSHRPDRRRGTAGPAPGRRARRRLPARRRGRRGRARRPAGRRSPALLAGAEQVEQSGRTGRRAAAPRRPPGAPGRSGGGRL